MNPSEEWVPPGVQIISSPRCEACEAILLPKQNDEHIQQAYVCCNPQCSRYGRCLTCAMLREWFEQIDRAPEL